tara:strand:+ start:214 stop:432 length:219 start_codon:yes stop_codon:yes gene_type:complete
MEDGENISSKVNNIFAEISKLEKELLEFQKKCKHPGYKLDFKNGTLIKICTDCQKFLGYPDDKDKKDAGYIN